MSRHFVPALIVMLGLLPGTCSLALADGRAPRDAARYAKPPEPGIYRYEELTSIQTARIDRQKTLVLQPVGMLQPGGPHLPVGADNVIAEALVEKTAAELRTRNPGLNVLIMPLLPIGTGAMNEMGYVFNSTASVTLSRRVTEAVLVDWGLNFAANSWRNLFFVSFHHDPSQYAILTDVSRFMHEGYGMNSANITSMVLADSSFQIASARQKGAPESLNVIFELNGGAAETSLLLALKPETVDPDYKQLGSIPVASWDQATATAQQLGWPYYFGHPAAANAEFGRNLLDVLAREHAALILTVVGDHTFAENAPHFEDALKKEFSLREVVRSSEDFEIRQHQKYQAWLRRRQPAPAPDPGTTRPGAADPGAQPPGARPPGAADPGAQPPKPDPSGQDGPH